MGMGAVQEDDRLVTVAEAARLLGKTPRAVRMMVQRQQLPSCRLGTQVRFRQSELLAFIAGLPRS